MAFGLGQGLLTALVLTGKGEQTARDMGLPPLTGECMVLEDREPDRPHVLARDVAALAAWLLARNAALASWEPGP